MIQERYLISEHVELMQEDGHQIVVHQASGKVLQVNQEVVSLLEYLKTERSHDELKTFFEIELQRADTELEQEVRNAIELLQQYALIKTAQAY